MSTVTAVVTTSRTVTLKASPDPAGSTTAAASPAKPRGTLHLQTWGGSLGQGFPTGGCANLKTRFVNQSDTAIEQITIAAASGEYTYFSGWDGNDFPTVRAAKPGPALLNVYLAPSDDVTLDYKLCTVTRPPGNPDFEFGVMTAKYVTFRWVTGFSGRACFSC